MKLDWRGVLGIAVSVALLAYTLRDESVADIWRVVSASNVLLVGVATLAATLIFPLRALRWRVILEPVGDVSYTPLWRSTAIGMMVNNIMPARAGELARAYALSRTEPKIRFTAALASLVVDRIVDAIVIVTLLVVGLAMSPFPADTVIFGQPVQRIAMITGALATAGLALLVTLALFPRLVLTTYDVVLGRTVPRLHGKLRPFLLSFVDGLAAVRSPSRFLRILAWAFALWLLNALAFWIAFVAMGIDVPFAAALFVQGLIALAVAAPSAPGFFGVFEVSGVAGLALYGIPRDMAVSWALGFHILTFLPITLLGLFYFARLGLHFRELGAARKEGAA